MIEVICLLIAGPYFWMKLGELFIILPKLSMLGKLSFVYKVLHIPSVQ